MGALMLGPCGKSSGKGDKFKILGSYTQIVIAFLDGGGNAAHTQRLAAFSTFPRPICAAPHCNFIVSNPNSR